ncbi:MAG: hypothetical protein QM750_19960 [Rubrivivax sp.]
MALKQAADARAIGPIDVDLSKPPRTRQEWDTLRTRLRSERAARHRFFSASAVVLRGSAGLLVVAGVALALYVVVVSDFEFLRPPFAWPAHTLGIAAGILLASSAVVLAATLLGYLWRRSERRHEWVSDSDFAPIGVNCYATVEAYASTSRAIGIYVRAVLQQGRDLNEYEFDAIEALAVGTEARRGRGVDENPGESARDRLRASGSICHDL